MPRRHRGSGRAADAAGQQAAASRLGANVRRLRTELDLTQEALAERCDCAPNYIQRIEYGKENVTLRMLAALGRALAADLTELVRAPRSADSARERIGRTATAAGRLAANIHGSVAKRR